VTAAYAAAAVLIVGTGAAHSVLGERLILRRLDVASLPPTPIGGRDVTQGLVRVAWHLWTAALLVMAGALGSCAAVGPSDACRAVGWITGGSFASFLAIASALALFRRSPRLLLTHPAPLLFAVVAALAWWGAS
jgi:hypothetical protein